MVVLRCRAQFLPLLVFPLAACFGPLACGPVPRPRPLPPADRMRSVEHIVRQAADRYRVDPSLVRGVIYVESGFHADARSGVGARGLMQLMPRTAASLARRLGWDEYDVEDPEFNITAGTAYLAYLLDRFDGDRRLALAAYHTGPARVSGWVARGQPLPRYSRRYIEAVLSAQQRLASGLPEAAQELPELDRSGLRALLRERLYGPRSDEPVPTEPSATLLPRPFSTHSSEHKASARRRALRASGPHQIVRWATLRPGSGPSPNHAIAVQVIAESADR